MLATINAIKRAFRDQYGFAPVTVVGDEPLFGENVIPDGTYPMNIDGKPLRIEIREGRIWIFDAPYVYSAPKGDT